MKSASSAATIKSFVITVSFVFLFVVAVLLDLQYLYLMAVTIALLPLASYALAWFLAARYTAVRTHPETVPEGRQTSIRVEVTARGGLPQTVVQIADALPSSFARLDGGSSTGKAYEPLDHWDGQQGERVFLVEPLVRGVFDLGPTRLETMDPLGLFTFGAEIGGKTSLVVHPVALTQRDRSGGGEGALGFREREGTARRGEGMEFHAVREYRPGDPLRRVHWRTSARTGQLAVVEHERAYQQDIVIALDLARGTEFGQGRDTTLEYAIKVAATLVERTLGSGGGVTLICQEGRAEVRPRQGDPVVDRFRLFDLLARVKANSDVALVDVLLAARLPSTNHLAVLTASGDSRLTTYLAERIRHGDRVRIFFFEPVSFGGPQSTSPAVPKAELRIVERIHSPWEEGGKRLEYLLRES